MQEHIDLINKFYEAFAKGDAATMTSCYHHDLEFSDPGFGKLNSGDAKAMWTMLNSRNSGLELSHSKVWADENEGGAYWEAKYTFSQTGRFVHNKINAKFKFKDGLIIQHDDYFSFWKWSSMALGMPGYLLGWSSFLQTKVNKTVLKLLKKFREENE